MTSSGYSGNGTRYSGKIFIFTPPCKIIMPRKGKKTNHTASEIAAKIAAHKPRGGGAAGAEDRKPKCALVCPLCKAEIHNATMMIQHYVARHPNSAPPAPSP